MKQTGETIWHTPVICILDQEIWRSTGIEDHRRGEVGPPIFREIEANQARVRNMGKLTPWRICIAIVHHDHCQMTIRLRQHTLHNSSDVRFATKVRNGNCYVFHDAMWIDFLFTLQL